MALHGDIKVNDRTIGAWEAIRDRKWADPESPTTYRYECRVQQIRNDGEYTLLGPAARFEVFHNHSDGAFVLTSIIFVRAVGIFAGGN